MPKGRVAGKVALVTGAARGIGEAIARLLVREGAKVVVSDIATDQGQAVADAIGATFLPLDVSDEGAWEAAMAVIEADYGRLDVLVNNAAITGLDEALGPLDPENISFYAWQHVHRVTLDGIFLGCKHAIGLMKKGSGSIINISSRCGLVGVPMACAYASSKAAVRNHTKSVALYCTDQGYPIRCNCIFPAAILTPIWDPLLGDLEQRRREILAHVSSNIPLGHMGEPNDVAYLALYLASDESKFMTGSELVIDGGILAGSKSQPLVAEVNEVK